MTAQTIMNPADFRPFMIWLSAEMKRLKKTLPFAVHVSWRFHRQIVNRHTDAADLRFIWFQNLEII